MTYTVSSGTLNSTIPYHTALIVRTVCISVNLYTIREGRGKSNIFNTIADNLENKDAEFLSKISAHF